MKQDPLIEPEFGAEVGEASWLTGLGVDQRKTFSIGHDPKRDSRGVQELSHPRSVGRVPCGGSRPAVWLLFRRQNRDQNSGLVGIHQDQVRPKGFVVLGDRVCQVLRNRVVLHQPILGPAEEIAKHRRQPLALDWRYNRRELFPGDSPFLVKFPEFPCRVGRVLCEKSCRCSSGVVLEMS